MTGLELVLGDGIGIVAVGAARDRALRQRQRLADDQSWDRCWSGVSICAKAWICASMSAASAAQVVPAVVVVGQQALIEARVGAAGRRERCRRLNGMQPVKSIFGIAAG